MINEYNLNLSVYFKFNGLFLLFISFFSRELVAQNLTFKETRFCEEKLLVADHEMLLKKSGNDLYLLAYNKSKEISFLCRIRANSRDTLIGLEGQRPYDFCLDSLGHFLYLLYGDEMVKYSLIEANQVQHTKINIGKSNSIHLINNTLFVVNYIHQGLVQKPQIEIFDAKNLKSLGTRHFISENYHAFGAAISPFQTCQVKSNGHLLWFIDVLSGNIDFYDVLKDSFFVRKILPKDSLKLKEIKEFSESYYKKNSTKTFQKIEDILNNWEQFIIQSFVYEESLVVFSCNGSYVNPEKIDVYQLSFKDFIPVYIGTFSVKSTYSESINKDNYSINEIFTQSCQSMGHQLYFMQSVNACFTSETTVSQGFGYQPGSNKYLF